MAQATIATPDVQGVSAEERRYLDNGFLILRGFFDPARIAAVKRHIDELWETRHGGSPFVMDCYLGQPREARIYFRDAADDARRGPYKLNDLHLADPVIQQLCTAPRLVAALHDLLSSPPIVINTLFLEYGSQQPAHFDTFFMPSRTPNMMIASWIAIDPVTDTNGPLFYYPGSHRIEPYRFSNGQLSAVFSELPEAEAHIRRIVEAHGLQRTIFHAQPGDVLIWHAQLLHGGCPIANVKETRTSLVTHYWTLRDLPNTEDRIELGSGQFLRKRSHQAVLGADAPAEIDRFVQGLATAPEDLAAVPPDFDPRRYLLQNKDVFASRADPYTHYLRYGRQEGRLW